MADGVYRSKGTLSQLGTHLGGGVYSLQVTEKGRWTFSLIGYKTILSEEYPCSGDAEIMLAAPSSGNAETKSKTIGNITQASGPIKHNGRCFGLSRTESESLDSASATVSNPISAPSSFAITPSQVIEGGSYTLRWENPDNANKISLFENSSTSPLKQWTGTLLPESYTFSNKPVGSYSYQLQACNSLECSPLSPERVAKVTSNQPPSINWQSGDNGGHVEYGQVKTFYVTADDNDGSIGEVEFFYQPIGSTTEQSIGNATKDTSQCQNCFRLNWTPSEGEFEVWAVATDNLGASNSLYNQRVTIDVDSNKSPIGSLVNPPKTIAQYNTVTLKAEAEDPDGSVASVKFLLSGAGIGTVTKPVNSKWLVISSLGPVVILPLDTNEKGEKKQYQLVWTPGEGVSGDFTLSVKVTDNEGRSRISLPQPLSVTAATIPPAPNGLTIGGETQPGINRTGNYTLRWVPVASTTEYQIWQSKDGSPFSLFKENIKDDGFFFSNQSSGHYRYQVRACNPLGCGAPSDEIAITVDTLEAPRALSARPHPESGSSNPQFTGSYTLAWNPTSNQEVIYHLQEKPGGAESQTAWNLIQQGSETSALIENKSSNEYAYQVLACDKENPQVCSEPSNQVLVSVLTPVLTAASLSCGEGCLALSGLGLDPDLSLTLTGVADPKVQQTFAAGAEALEHVSTTSLRVSIAPGGALYDQLFKLGVRARVTNPNGAIAGMTAYGNRDTELIGESSSSPAIGPNGVVYVAVGKQLHALKQQDGTSVKELGWPFTADGFIRATPSIDSTDGTIYVGALDENFYAITPYALEKWRLPTRGKVVSRAVQDENRVLYFGTIISEAEANEEGSGTGDEEKGILYAVNASATKPWERVKWTYPTSGGIIKEPVLAGENTLYFSTAENNQIYALTRDNEGPGKLIWESVGDPALWEEIGNWAPDPSREPEYLSVARLYRSLLQPELPFSGKILTFWTYQLVGGNTTHKDIAEAFLVSTSGQANFSEVFKHSDSRTRAEAFVDTLYQRLFPEQGQPNLTWGGRSYSRDELIDTAEGLSLAHAATLFAQSEEYVYATNALLRRSFKYLYEQDYSWAVTSCDDGDAYTRDCDGDGLPDWWEILFLGDTSYGADDDPDNDGVTNIVAFNSRTSPCANGCYNGVVETPPEPAASILPDSTAMAISAETGTLPGQFRVNEAGAATYSIPLSLPVGTAGVAPQLALNYSSQGGNGLLGQGWNLSGLSSVTRCRQTLGQDGQNRPITWGSEDRFCLDGQRLLLVNGGSYGAPGSQYRTEIDSFTLVTAHGGSAGKPSYFTLERKDGSINYYGQNTNGNNAQQSLAGFGTLSWVVSRTEDSAGNPVEYFYDQSGGHRIREIRYAYGDSSSPAASVTFDYEAREDVISSHVAGAKITNNQRLQAITTHGVQSALLRRYELDYLRTDYEEDVLSRIERIRECVGSVCHPDTVFEWRLPAIFFTTDSASTVKLNDQEDRTVSPRPADINGDGRMDIVWLEVDWDQVNGKLKIRDQYLKYVLATEQGYGPEQQAGHYGGSSLSPYRWEVFDYNADGRADVALFRRSGADGGIWKLHQSVYSNGAWSLSTSPIELSLDKNTRFVDINGDGLADAVTSSGYKLLEPSGASTDSANFYHFGALQSWQMPAPPPFNPPSWDDKTLETYLNPDVIGDFDGDGQVDLILMQTLMRWDKGDMESQWTRAHVVKVQGNQLVLGQQVMDSPDGTEQTWGFKGGSDETGATSLQRHPYLHRKLRAVDINSDGLVDLVQEDTTGNSPYSYRLNTGAGFATPVSLGSFPKDAQPSWLDYEGDGDLDLVWRREQGDREELRLRRWQSDQQIYSAEENFRIARKGGLDMFLDMNGDGSTDWMEFADDYLRIYHSPDRKVAPNVIEKITNGLGAQTHITFGSSVTSGHYARLDIGAVLESHCGSGNTDAIEDWCTQYGVSTTSDFYRALNSDWQGQHTLGKTSPVLEMLGTQFLVTQVDSSAPATNADTAGQVDSAATSTISYMYGGARLQAGGRGLLGFESLRTIDAQSGIKTTTHYRQDFPFRGYPLRTETRTPQGYLLGESDNTWILQGWQSSFPSTALNGTIKLGPLMPVLATSVEKSYDFVNDGQAQGVQLKTVTTSTEKDNDGNVIRVHAVTETPEGDRFSTETVNVYGSGAVSFQNPEHNFNSYLQLGRLLNTTVTHSRSEGGQHQEAVRKSAFTYYDSGNEAGLLKQEILEPGDSLQLTTRYEYDDFGNKTLAEQSTANEEPRTQRWVYNSNGRFVDEEVNGYNQTLSRVLQRNSAGHPTEVEDIVGVVSQITYDVFNRQVHSYSSTGAQSSSLLAPAGAQCPSGASTQQRDYSGGGGETLTCYDLIAREVRKATRAFDGGWNYVDIEYDNVGRVKHQSEPYKAGATAYWTTHDYDRLGRVIGTDLPGISNSRGTRWDLTLEYQGTTTTAINPKGQRKVETSNVVGEKVRAQDNANNTLEFTHDAEGQLLQVINKGNGSRNLITRMTYDLLGRKDTMSDPDKGDWEYVYNGYGELKQQTDAKGQRVENTYDILGRLTERRDFDTNKAVKTTKWFYNNDQSTGENGVPPAALIRVEAFDPSNSSDSYAKLYSYDHYGRPSETITSFSLEGGDDHYEKTNYDQFSRPFQIFDAGGDGSWESSAIRHHYNQYGYLAQVVDAELRNLATAEQFYTVVKMDARGNVTEHLSGNGITTIKDYHPATGLLRGQTASVLGVGDLQYLSYDWDDVGNLENRVEQSGGKNLREDFLYDELNRLTSAQVAGREAQTLRYDDLGNITFKSDVGEYRYGSQCDQGFGPHAVCETSDGVRYQYDANGNMTEDSSGRRLKYTTFDKPYEIQKGGHKTEFKYGPDRMRYLRIDTDKSGQVTETRSIGNVEKITKDGTTEIKRYLPGGALISLTVNDGDNEGQYRNRSTQYLHKDHLGSLDVITDSKGEIANDGEAVYSFDAWGQRRNAVDWSLLASTALTDFDNRITTRGYTGHEMLDQVGLIHMNGRIYDPMLGRFLQADPHVQSPGDTQMYNRYSYVRNNPLNASDPSGYFLVTLAAIAAYAITADIAITAVVVGVVAFGQALHAGADFGDALIAGVSAAAMTYAAGVLAPGAGAGFKEIALYGLQMGAIGGMTSVLQGGKFGHGFVSAGVGSAVGAKIGGFSKGFSWSNVGKAAVRITLSGTISKATGGKFANGAGTAAFSIVVNNSLMGREPTATEVRDARMADAAYKGQVGDSVGSYTIEDIKTDPSGLRAALFVDGDSKVIAYAGTDPSSINGFSNDMGDNVNQAYGRHSDQYAAGIKYAIDKGVTHFAGHSLGGGIASAAAIATGGSATIFNAAGLHNNTVGGIPRSNANIVHFRSTFDIVQPLNSFTPSSVPGEQVSLGTGSGFHGMGDVCRVMGCY
ncbi:RHS repeat-associated core domain-containing protein [Microbulbifer sp. SSSA005]|uniref:RHS repeat-associated core domain-containing protein n=1 Tax=Microbulbifer sp. SSSA005 TaxID=3243378 RepID=UPI004039C36A